MSLGCTTSLFGSVVQIVVRLLQEIGEGWNSVRKWVKKTARGLSEIGENVMDCENQCVLFPSSRNTECANKKA